MEGFDYIPNKYFKRDKLACQHCGAYHFSEEWLKKIIKIREQFGKPVVCASGYRCKDHPIERKKTNLKRVSPHPSGFAMDCRIKREDYAEFIKIALNEGCRVGVRCQSSGVLRLHIDMLIDREIHFWTYSA